MAVNDHQNEKPWEMFENYLDRQGDWLEKIKGNLMIVATVIAAMSFQVMANPPGGVWQSDGDATTISVNGAICTGMAGTSTLECKSSKHDQYSSMVICSTVSFTASMSIILLLITGLQLRNRMVMALLTLSMMAAVICIAMAFLYALLLVNQPDDDIIIQNIVLIYFGIWILFAALILLSVLVRLIVRLIRCCCAFRQRPTPTRRSP